MPTARLLKSVFTVLLFCGAPLTAHALQLGESRAQILTRHGAPGSEDRAQNVAMYFWDGWSAQVEYQGETARQLTYRRNWYLGESDIGSLLQSNGGLARWKEETAAGAKTRQWRRDDGALASCQAERAMSMTFQIAGATKPPAPVPVVTPKIEAATKPAVAVPVAAPKIEEPTKPPAPVPIVAAKIEAPAKPPAPVPVAAPKTEAPPTPPIFSSPAPELPKPLESGPKPESSEPAASAPEAPASAVAFKPAARSLPKLRTEEIPPAPPSAPEASAPEPALIEATPVVPSPAVSQPNQEPPPPHAPAANKRGSSGGILGPLVFFGILAGTAFYFRKWLAARIPPRRATFAPEPARPSPRALAPNLVSLRGDQVELLVGEIFRRQGCTVELSSALGQDDSIDLTLRRDSETILVQCKHWQSPRVTERELREFYGAMAATGAPRGIVVTTGAFTRDAREFAEGKGIDLIDGAKLQESMAEVARPGEDLADLPGWIEQFAASAHIFDPECPACQGSMAIRTNRTNGAQVWACRSYPRCPGKREPRPDLLAVAAGH